MTFEGEKGIDAGGVYREALTRIVESLFSRSFTLLIPCPNAEHQTGMNLGAFVPNPKVSECVLMARWVVML